MSVPLGVMESCPMPKRLSGAVADEMSPTNEVPAHRSRPHVNTPGQSRASDAPAATSSDTSGAADGMAVSGMSRTGARQTASMKELRSSFVLAVASKPSVHYPASSTLTRYSLRMNFVRVDEGVTVAQRFVVAPRASVTQIGEGP